MNALVIAPQPFFSPRGTPFSVYYRTLIMAELGVTVDLLTYGQGQDVDIPGVRIRRIPRFRMLGKVKVGPSYLKLFLDVVLFLKLVGLLLTRRYDFVHAHEEAVFFCVLLKPVFRFKLLYDMHSSLPQQLTSFQFTRSRFLIGLFEKLELAALRASRAVITICEDLYLYADPFLKDDQHHELIENSLFDPVRLVSTGENATLQAIEARAGISPDAPLVLYAGTLEPYQGIDMTLHAFQQVAQQNPTVRFLVAGGSPEQVAHYRNMANALGLTERCTFTGMVPKSVATAFNTEASVLLSPRTTGGNTPLKIYEQLASGIPLVATNIHSHTQVLNEAVAYLVPPTPEGLAAGILQALTPGPERDNKVRNAQELYRQKYNREQYIRKMKRVLESLR